MAGDPRQAACPKHLIYGPCGGVEADGGCELGTQGCSFLSGGVVRSDELPTGNVALIPQAAAMQSLIAQRQVVIADFPGKALDSESLRQCSDELADQVDAVLVGDSPTSRVQYSPVFRAHKIGERGLPVWSGLNCRDRNRVALQGELASLAEVGVAGVHCVTGDHPLLGHRGDTAPVFDLDSTRLANLAATFGHLVSVAESPASPPVQLRPARLKEKRAAVCFVNHCGDAESVGAFISAAQDLGVSASFIGCVPVVIDRGSAAQLAGFAGLVLPGGYLDPILNADDPYRAGIRAAVEFSLQLLALPGIAGINLSGASSAGGEEDFARAMSEIAGNIRR